MATYFTADTHLGHARIIEHCGRPYETVEQMDDDIIDIWNRHVLPGDTVWHLGDFAWGDADLYRQRLNGHINLIVGNHEPGPRGLAGIFNCVDECRLDVKVQGVRLTLCHYPWDSWPGRWMLHGHSHGRSERKTNRFDVGWDVWRRPITIDDIKQWDGNYTLTME